jgi:hypothetical protein
MADSSDLRTVQFVIRDVDVENVTFVVTAPEGVTPRLARAPPSEETTAPEETTTEVETTLEETTTEPEETTEPAETTPEETTTVPGETVTEEPADESTELRVFDLTAPSTVVLNEEQLVVNARVTNPGDQTVTETVELRVGGTVVEERQVEVGPGESERVQFSVDRQTLDLEPGDTFVGVLTRDYGQVKQVTVREPGEQDDETAEATTTEDEPAETTTEPEETTEPAETTPGETTTEVGDADADATDAESASLRVSDLDAPSSLVLDEGTLIVTAELENPTDNAVTETVELRVDGTVVETQQVEVGPGETTQVRFEVDKQDLDLAPGETFLEVLTRDFGESIMVTVESDE